MVIVTRGLSFFFPPFPTKRYRQIFMCCEKIDEWKRPKKIPNEMVGGWVGDGGMQIAKDQKEVLTATK